MTRISGLRAYAGGAVGDGVGAEPLGSPHQTAGDDRPGEGGPEEVVPLIHRVGLERGEYALPDQVLPQILDHCLGSAG